LNRSGTLRKFYSEKGFWKAYMQICLQLNINATETMNYDHIMVLLCLLKVFFLITQLSTIIVLKSFFFLGRQLWIVGLTILDDINTEPRIWFIIPNKYTMPSLVIFYKESFFVYFHIFGLPKHYRIKFHHCNFMLKLTSWKTQNS
jgi:hypothetical protein